MKEPRIGILLMNYGAPEKLEDVEPFLTRIFAGRKVPPSVLERVHARYRAIGGGSPLLSTTRCQAEQLEKELNQKGGGFRTFLAMLHSPPFAAEALAEAAAAGVNRVMVVSLSPFYSRISTGAYFAAAEKAWQLKEFSFQLDFAGEWYENHCFLRAVAEEISHCLEKKGPDWKPCFVFTAHSLPKGEDAELYQSQILRSVKAVMAGFPHCSWRIAFQSKGGGTLPWLGPELDEVFEETAAAGKNVLAVPIGFISDNLETLYDLDVEAAEKAFRLGIDFVRCPALNGNPLLIKGLADIVNDQLRNEMIL